jgi:hypothetical protein
VPPFISSFLEKIASWSSIARIQKSTAIKTTAFWFVATPLLANLAQQETVATYLKGVSLPFTWGLLFLASLFFSVARFLYLSFCPKIIREFSGWEEYNTRDSSYTTLVTLMIEILHFKNREERMAFIFHQMRRQNFWTETDYGKHVGIAAQGNQSWTPQEISSVGELKVRDPEFFERLQSDWEFLLRYRTGNFSNDRLPNLFAELVQQADSVRPTVRTAVVIVHAFGFAILLAIALQHIHSVYSYYFS